MRNCKLFLLLVLIYNAASYKKRVHKRAAVIPVSSGFPQIWNSNPSSGPSISYRIEYSTDRDFTSLNVITQRPVINEVAAEINAKTCLNLQLEPNPLGNYISLGVDASAPSNCKPEQFGRIRDSANPIKIPLAFCTKTELRRLFLATLGIHYLHQRADSNHYVAAVPQTAASTSIRVGIPAVPPQTFSVPYDFSSIMSVSNVDNFNFFKTSATCSIPSAVLDNADISELDFYLINKLYGCTLTSTCSTNNPCQNNAACFDKISGSPYCHCLPGYNGTLCETNIFMCNPNPCQNGGTCSPGTNGVLYTCSCPPSFSGDNCEKALVNSGWRSGSNGYQYTTSTTSMTWLEANKFCLDHDSNLAYIGVRNPSSFTQLFNVTFKHNDVWIGLAKMNGSFAWCIDGIESKQNTWTKWGPSEPDMSDNKLCAMIRGNTSFMFSENCNLSKRALCEKPLGNPPTFPTYKASNNLTYFVTPPMSFYAAKRECKRYGAWLAVDGVATSSLLLTITQNIVPLDPSPAPKFFYVGFEDTDSPNTFKPVKTGTNIEQGDARWTNTYGGDPNNWENMEECVASKRDINGELVDIDCGQRRLRLGLCETNELKIGSGVSSTITCNEGFYLRNGVCEDVNECASLINPCGAQGTCINCLGSYTCHCASSTTFNSATGQCA